MRRGLSTGIVVLFAAVLMFPAVAAAQPDEAGDLPGTAAIPEGGQLGQIDGTLGHAGDVDMFALCLAAGGTFSATVPLAVDPVSDGMLSLFASNGTGVYNSDGFPGPALLPAGDLLTPQAAGTYYLAVSHHQSDAESAGGQIFPEGFPDVNGPTGPGGELPLTGWQAGNALGPYSILLMGAWGGRCSFGGATGTPVCIESTLVQTDKAAAGLGVGNQFTGTDDNVFYMIISGAPTCKFNCLDGFDVNCDGKVGDFCPIELNRNHVKDAGICLELLAAKVDATAVVPVVAAAGAGERVAVPVPDLAQTGSETSILGYLGSGLIAFGAVALGGRRKLLRSRR